MERKANQFVHKLAEKLKQSGDVAKDNDSLKHNFREVVKAMDHGRLKKELQRHLSLYFKKLMHKLHSDSSFEDKSHASDDESTTGLDSTTSQTPGSIFNLYTVESQKLTPLTRLNQRDVLIRLCVSSNPAAIKILSDHFEDEMSFSQLKEVSRIMIGQREPEVVFKYLSMVVTNIGTELEPALTSGNEERCAEFCDFIDNLLTVVHHKLRMSGMSIPSNCNPRIESLMAALLSMLVDLSAVLSRSSDDPSPRAQQIVTQVLLHLQHSPSYLLDVLLQLSSSSQDANFLVPLFRHILSQYRAVHGNCDFLKYVCAVRLAKKILSSVIPDEVNTFSQEACFKTPTNLAMWLQESAGQWLHQVLEKNKEEDTKDIVRFILEGADDEEVQELLNVLVSDDVDTKEDETEDQQEEEADFFFVDTSQDGIQGLPQDFNMLEEPDDAESDSDLQDEIKLADELLAELDSGKLSSSKEADLEEDETKSDNMQMEDKEIEGHLVAVEPMDTSEDTTSSRRQGQRSRSPDLFVIQEEVSFEEMRAKALGHDGNEELSQKDEDKEKDTEADDENSEDEEEEDDHRRLEESPSQTKVETRQRRAAVSNQRLSNQRNGQTARRVSSSEDEKDDQEERSNVKAKSPSDKDSSESDSEISVSAGESKTNGKQLTGSTRQDAFHHLTSRSKEEDVLPGVSSNKRAQKTHAVSGSEDDGESSPVQRKDDERSSQTQGNQRSRRSLRRSAGKKKTEKLEGSVNQTVEVVSSSEIEERSPVNQGHQRLSFPMLEQTERKNTVSPKNRKRSFKSPKIPSDRNSRKERKLEETRGENEENIEEDRSSEVVSREVADYIKQIREQSATNQPRRSARIRQSSTSSVESRGDRRENLRTNPTMTLRSRRSAQKNS